jgi:hypothetical protein
VADRALELNRSGFLRRIEGKIDALSVERSALGLQDLCLKLMVNK